VTKSTSGLQGTYSLEFYRVEPIKFCTALAVETSEEWLTSRRYLDIEELKQERSRERAGAEVVFTER
jgi:hypothetical protein